MLPGRADAAYPVLARESASQSTSPLTPGGALRRKLEHRQPESRKAAGRAVLPGTASRTRSYAEVRRCTWR